MAIIATIKALVILLITTTSALPAADLVPTPCVSSIPVVTAGYTINYAPATPSPSLVGKTFHPRSDWEAGRIVATYTYGVPEPKETGFAYAQFKCQYTCNGSTPPGHSFFVKSVGDNQSLCTCYNDLLEPASFTPSDESLTGAWNAICK